MAHDTQITSSMRIDRALVNSTVNLELSISADSAPFYLFLYHRDRMLRAAEEFGWTEAAEAISGLHGACYLLNSVTTHLKEKGWDAAAQLQPLKVRVMLSETGTLTCISTMLEGEQGWSLFPSSLDVPTVDPSEAWLVYLYPEPIEMSRYTRHKTTQRSMYDASRQILGGSSRGEEVLLQNPEGQVMEGSITTPYFRRNGQWVTPAATCGGNLGTSRRWALEKGIAVEDVIMMHEIKPNERIVLSNGVRGFIFGIIHA